MTAGAFVAGAVVAAGRKAAARVMGMVVQRASGGGRPDPARWRVVTVYRPIEELLQALPAPLAELGDTIEVDIRNGPGAKGTEVAARIAPSRLAALQDRPQDRSAALEELRSALRRAKQEAEIGWVHEADVTSSTRTTPLNAPLQEALRHAGGEGRL